MDYKKLSEQISDIIQKSKLVDIDSDDFDEDVYIFVGDMMLMETSLKTLYNKIDSGSIEDNEYLVKLIDAIIMDYKAIVYHYRIYDTICNSIGLLINELEYVKTGL